MTPLKRIFPVLIVLFLGYLGFSIVLPLFPPLFLDPEHSFLPSSMTMRARSIYLGLLFAMYPLGQFLGSPLLGKLSDKYGRKPILLISLIAVIPTYIGSALSVTYALPLLLYISRFFGGLLEGNIVIAQASIADISESSHSKAKNFGWLVTLGSSAFFFGPLMGGKLADSTLVSWFSYDTPFWAGALFTLIGIIAVQQLFQETHVGDKSLHITIKTVTKSFIDGMKIKHLQSLYAANFTLFMGIFFFLNFFSAYLVNKYQFSVSILGDVNAYLAIPITLSPFLFGHFAKWWTSRQSMRFSALFLCISLLIFTIPTSPWFMLITLLPVGFFLAMGFTFPALMVSDSVSKKVQGQALGTNQALQVLAEGATALIGGSLIALHNNAPVYAGAFCCVFAALILFSRKPTQASG